MTHQNRDLCLRLLKAPTEEDVVSTLRAIGFWDDRAVWRPYGDISNNRGVVGNQQSSPVAALVEKLVNSIDAVLTVNGHPNAAIEEHMKTGHFR